ncbi:MAG: hypothetical protein IJX62_02680 [Clostridia bacterium]|nr:hypothetical protein [Clostridia bacterium]
MYRIGMSSESGNLTDALFSDYKKAGIHAIEIAFGRKPDKDIDYAEIKRLSDPTASSFGHFICRLLPFQNWICHAPISVIIR